MLERLKRRGPVTYQAAVVDLGHVLASARTSEASEQKSAAALDRLVEFKGRL